MLWDIQPCCNSQSSSLTLPVTTLTCHRWVRARRWWTSLCGIAGKLLMSSNFMPFLCPAAGGFHRLPCGDCRAGSTFTPVFIYRSSVWTVTGSPAAGQRSAHTHEDIRTHFSLSLPVRLTFHDRRSPVVCDTVQFFFFLYKKKTKVSIQILFKKIKSNSRFWKKKKKQPCFAHAYSAPRAHGPPSAEIQEVKKENIPGLFLGGKQQLNESY